MAWLSSSGRRLMVRVSGDDNVAVDVDSVLLAHGDDHIVRQLRHMRVWISISMHFHELDTQRPAIPPAVVDVYLLSALICKWARTIEL